jgi:hypothetical protein
MGEDASWGARTVDAFGKARFRLLLSGTPFRSDNSQIPWVRYDADGVSSADYDYGYTQALVDNVCRPVTFHTYGGDMEWVSDGKVRRADFDVVLPAPEAARRLRTALDADGDWITHVLKDANDQLLQLRAGDHPEAGGLVIGIDKEHADKAGDAAAVAELFIGGEGLARGPVDVLGTLLHEAVHGVAATRGVKETSRAGAYHNKRFKELGEELGLQIDRHPTIGWSTTTVPPAIATAYADQVEQLRAAIGHVRDTEHHARRTGPGEQPDDPGADPDGPGAGARSAPTYLCACETPRRLRMAPTVYALADVLCPACGQPFTAD